MRRLVEDLLTLARLDERHTVVRTAAVDAGPLLREIGEEAERLAGEHELLREIADDLPRIRADADRLRQVVLALLDNAFKYTPSPGQVTLRAHRANDQGLAIEVRDSGIGIPPEALPHVFERFYRVDPARGRTSAQAGGSGLGLAIARSLVEAQGGQIAIASARGEGTTVSLWFPGEQPRPTTPPPSPMPAAGDAVSASNTTESAAGQGRRPR
jgi:two-component system OmpR family sensor kinase